MDREALIAGIQEFIGARGGVLYAAQVPELAEALIPEPVPEPDVVAEPPAPAQP